MRGARCPSCGTKVTIAEGQPLPRCKHCWSPLVADADDPATTFGPSQGSGLDALFAAYEEEAGAAPEASGTATPPCCPWCGAFSKPGLFCSDCGSSLLQVV